MKAPEAGYRLWLARRVEEGNDLARCRRQIEVWAANPPEGTVRSLFVSMLEELDGRNVGAYLLEARTFFRIILQRFRPAHVVYEAPVRVQNQALQIKLHGLPGILEMECVERGVKPDMVYPSTIKARLAGHGHAKKPAMIVAARGLVPTIDNADEADALGAWLCGLHHYSPDLWPAWERRLRGADID